jgi:16S rRNA (guanine966-N2)-methyltransferase
MFDVLGSVLGVDGWQGATVVDLFAGSGALGIEALSRGAARAVLVDRDRRAIAAIRHNLAMLGVTSADRAQGQGEGEPAVVVTAGVATGCAEVVHAEVVHAEVEGWLAGAGRGRWFDVAFCDPPYAFDRWSALLDAVPASLAVAETDRPLQVPARWVCLKRKRYGGTLVTVAARLAHGRVGSAVSSARVAPGSARSTPITQKGAR